MTDPVDNTPTLARDAVRRIQQIVGTFLFYGRAVDVTMLVALSTLSAQQANATAKTAEAITKFLNYAASHPDAKIRFHASDMRLKTHVDASYLTEPQARSRAGAYHFMGNNPGKPDPPNQAAVLADTHVMKNVLASAAEAEIGSTFDGGKDVVILQTTANEMGHPQNGTPIQVDNSTSHTFANNKLKQKRSRAIDMRFYWVQDRVQQGQFIIYWAPGSENKADYLTKHFSAADHHRK